MSEIAPSTPAVVYLLTARGGLSVDLMENLAPDYACRAFGSLPALLIALASDSAPDLVLIDGEAPEFRQSGLYERLGAALRGRIVPTALLLSREALAEHVELALQYCDDFVVYPAAREVLIARLKLLQRQQAKWQKFQQTNDEQARQIHDSHQELLRANFNLQNLVALGLEFGAEKDRRTLLQKILETGKELTHCQAATLFIRTERNTLRFELRTAVDELPMRELPLLDAETGQEEHRFVATHCALSGETIVIDDVYTETRFDLSGTKLFSSKSGMRSVSMLAVPMSLMDGEVIGVLQLVNATDPNTSKVITFSPDLVRTIEAMAAQGAVALENLRLIDAQKALMDSLIQIIAGAIDTKSPYTGGHNLRVPALAFMLAEAAEKVEEGSLADFAFLNEDEWREFRVGAWLHDCGKVTSPEYVMDKATKLETIYNRIHEVRTRFEVLLRDAHIQALQSLISGQSADDVWAAYEEKKRVLEDDFAFVAECNLGGEFMAPEKIERLEKIAQQTWWRHFDNHLGLSEAELKRYPDVLENLPCCEFLLADKTEHRIPRDKPLDYEHDKFGFKIEVPELLYHHGEKYNLRIGRGTLNAEERFKVNEHIIQTIVMLDKLPLPKNLRRVPEYASTHHETMKGDGYPRRLSAKDLSVPQRIMAIADIFEALTAPDRPYKKTKTLSECVRILWFFKKDGHIDPDLFNLFLEQGIYQKYAQEFLMPEQIDEVDITPYLG